MYARRVLCPFIASFGLAIASEAAADVLTVDDNVGQDFLTVQAAIAAAQDGDTILVKTGIYLSPVINNLDVDIVAERDSNVYLFGALRVNNLAAGKRFLLSGLRVEGSATQQTPITGHGLVVTGCIGAVRIENCILEGANNIYNSPDCAGFGDLSGWEGAVVTNSIDVVFADCALLGGAGRFLDNAGGLDSCALFNAGGAGGTGCIATNSKVALFGSLVLGGPGGMGSLGGDGGDGYVGTGGTLFASGTQISADDGGIGFATAFGPGGDGGDGIRGNAAFGAGLFDSETTAGQGGASYYFADGQPGAPLAGEATYIEEAGVARLFASPSPTRVGELLELQFTGAPFDYVFLLVGGQDAFVPVTPFKGILLSNTAASLGLGFLDANGQRTDALVLAPLTGSPESLVVVLQSFHVSTSAELRLGSAVHQVLLDPAF